MNHTATIDEVPATKQATHMEGPLRRSFHAITPSRKHRFGTSDNTRDLHVSWRSATLTKRDMPYVKLERGGNFILPAPPQQNKAWGTCVAHGGVRYGIPGMSDEA